jgi:hypothetical protein
MIIQLILTGCLACVAVYGWAQLASVRIVSLGLMLLSSCAIYLVWNPDLTSRLANMVGVGRGTDLVLYLFLVFVLSQLVVIHVRLHAQMTLITQIARRIALDSARVPPQHNQAGEAPSPAASPEPPKPGRDVL